jgi:hypothetical protein
MYEYTPLSTVVFNTWTSEILKCPVFWNTTPCILSKLKCNFGGKYRFDHQGQRISHVTQIV